MQPPTPPPLPPAAQPLAPGDPPAVAHYALLARLGAGGMGVVYLARSPAGRLVALKVIRSDRADDATYRQRFAREATLARQVSGHYTAAVIEADPFGDPPWLAVEYVPAPALGQVVRASGPLAERSVHALAVGLVEALRAVHSVGLVHRDLKPGNVLLARDGPRLIDFGLARTDDTEGLTGTGGLVGTPSYVSPERVAGQPAGPPADVFALGGVLVYAATGVGPYGRGEPAEILRRVTSQPPDVSGVPESLRGLAAACLAPDPAARPSTDNLLSWLPPVSGHYGAAWLPEAAMGAVAAAEHQEAQLRAAPALAAPPPPQGRRRRWPLVAGAAATAVAVLAVGGVVALRTLGGDDAEEAAAEDATSDEAAPGNLITDPDAPTTADPPEPGLPATELTAEDIGEPAFVLNDPGGREISELAFYPDGEELTAVGNMAQTWDLETGLLSGDVIAAEGEWATAVLRPAEPVGPLGVDFVLGFNHGRVDYYTEDRDDSFAGQFYEEDEEVTDLAITPSGDYLLTAAATRDFPVRVWDMRDDDAAEGVSEHGRLTPAGGYTRFTSRPRVAWSPDGEWFLATMNAQVVTLVEMPDLTGDGMYLNTNHEILDLAVSPDGSTIATAGLNQAVHLWNAEGLLAKPPSPFDIAGGDIDSSYAQLSGHEGPTRRVVFNHDGSLLASVGLPEPDDAEDAEMAGPVYDTTVRLWGTADGEEIAVLDSDDLGEPRAVAFSPDSSLVAVADELGAIAVWELG